ncbi:hypothetical protein GR160_11320 [Flavobacterium sp. Sd200]|uniref:hypothetical protein n=1 Tax=Flavobacterium sp. Sd200 TaxID=2692211 RepID=UPI00136FF6DF|nr:hypothetical protein [Flavobacterium sp. Sd200]MXN91816.1 hypothetical protein [Flavobacterium sp. Sd200]
MKTITFFTLLFCSVIAYAQDIQQGYYIDASGQKTEGYFSYGNFAEPSTLKFGNSPEGNFEDFKYNDIMEYGVDGDFKYQKVTVDLEISTIKANEVSKVRNPEWASKTIFVNVLLEGDASLYSYYSPGGKLFFYKVDSKNVPLTQLVYKKYYTPENEVAISRFYQQQLLTDVNCNGQDTKDFSKVRYSQSSLEKLFTEYNQCKGGQLKTYGAKKDRSVKLEFTVFAGVNYSGMKLDNTNPPISDNTNTEAGFGFGGEVAITIPSRKFSFFVKADYERMSTDFVREWREGESYVKTSYIIDVNIINVYAGARYNYMLNSNNKLYADAAVVTGLPSGSFERHYYSGTSSDPYTGQLYETKPGKDMFFNFGLGYTLNNKYGIEFRVDTPRDFFKDALYPLETSSYRMSLNLRYTIN